ncbi:Hypothetical predicted protein [Olea europaea subsp. europaea]|uniref:Uncharacterized protein n=1 Tax=Olea europaea subsp. europaea TaxID=158383 RepID=A0A8S0SJC9_OLEEU|nr:Hypothetical predicted protein [Olea europaea subsp. europaea]
MSCEPRPGDAARLTMFLSVPTFWSSRLANEQHPVPSQRRPQASSFGLIFEEDRDSQSHTNGKPALARGRNVTRTRPRQRLTSMPTFWSSCRANEARDDPKATRDVRHELRSIFRQPDRKECVRENYVAACVLCRGQSTDTPRDFVPTHALRPASSCLLTVSCSNDFAPPDRTLGSYRDYVAVCILCLGQSTDTPGGFVPTHALRPASLCLTMVSIRDNFVPTDRTLGSCEHYVATCILCLGQSINTSRDFLPPRMSSVRIVPPTLVGSLLRFWIEMGNCREIRGHLSTRNAISYPHMRSVWVLRGGHRPEYRRSSTIVGRETCPGRHVPIPKAPKFVPNDHPSIKYREAYFQAFLGTECRPCPGRILAAAGTQPHFQENLGTVLWPCQGRVLATAGTQPDFQAILGTVCGPCSGRVLATTGTQPHFQAILGTVYRPCPGCVVATAGTQPDFQAILSTVCWPYPGRVLATAGTHPDFQAFLGTVCWPCPGRVLATAGTQPDFLGNSGHGVLAMSRTRPGHCRDAA